MNMDKGIELYKEFIDNFMTMSENCVDAVSVKKGNVVGCQAQEIGINDVLKNDHQKIEKSYHNLFRMYIRQVFLMFWII